MGVSDANWTLIARIVAHRELFDAAAGGAETAAHLLVRRQLFLGVRSADALQRIACAIGPGVMAHIVRSFEPHEVKQILSNIGAHAVADAEEGRRLLLGLIAENQMAERASNAPPPLRLRGHSALGARRIRPIEGPPL